MRNTAALLSIDCCSAPRMSATRLLAFGQDVADLPTTMASGLGGMSTKS